MTDQRFAEDFETLAKEIKDLSRANQQIIKSHR